ncbi:FAD-binding oxidoreductase [Nonomuraea sp. SYSU D8015]|uniref:FAD-binding oxidoreductase n=1 Tax=Nonomuraea sp. SYSU D8015 TaxID=2593644 RepID=UPI001660EF99|nr:FAD-binding oxidoreductase [Nonomuraea sp. SYSU D8015]
MNPLTNRIDSALSVVRAGEPGYDEARTAWNLAVDQRPAAVAMPRDARETAEAVRWAAAAGLRVNVQGTGHNAAPLGSLSDTLLIRTSGMREVTISPAAQVARVTAGAMWSDVVAPAAEHGLTPLAGSSHDVGVVGYTLGGGISWLARRHGLAANSVLAAEVVTADGRLRRVDAAHDPELFWALRGGGGDFAAVTALDIRLYPIQQLTAGVLFFPMERAAEVLDAWRGWLPGTPDELTSCGRLLRFPPIPDIPEPLRGGAFCAIELVHMGSPDATDELIAPLRKLGPLMDTVSPATPMDVLAMHMDPPGPVPALGDGATLAELPAEALKALLDAAGPAADVPLMSVELRHLGGAMGRRPAGAGALGLLDAEFALYAVGVVADPAMKDGVEGAVRHVLEAVAPWRAAQDYLNFRDTSAAPDHFFDPGTLERLRAVKNTYDPAGLFRSNHPIAA